MQIKGKYTTATVHTENIEDAAVQQIQEITDSPSFENQYVHYMPDVHIYYQRVSVLNQLNPNNCEK